MYNDKVKRNVGLSHSLIWNLNDILEIILPIRHSGKMKMLVGNHKWRFYLRNRFINCYSENCILTPIVNLSLQSESPFCLFVCQCSVVFSKLNLLNYIQSYISWNVRNKKDTLMWLLIRLWSLYYFRWINYFNEKRIEC